jgi:delta 1-pyrroline-5-carboxylate dehydrogenase
VIRMKFIGVMFMIVFVVSFLLHTLWDAYHISYHLKVWYEYLFIPVPNMTIHNLPKSVTDHTVGSHNINNENTTKDTDGKQQQQQPIVPRPSLLIDPQRPNMIQCYDPSTDEHLGEVIVMTPEQVHDCCQKASIAQQRWCRTTFAQRRLVLRTIQQYIIQNADFICRMSALDSGKPMIDGYLGEILTTTEKIRTICSMGEIWLLPSYRSTGVMFCYKIPRVEYVPYGIIAPIAPWNYP